ncbi:Hypothetical predicted protein [Cloeon dipterum]|uniref:C2H2-type domain-containing protein n=1 Tax=Cloeon dipterum TaxID=197152 RepID=A0A8S1C5X6_9INSE|nr:Hypothetical predicted protein [Cloeon dipterum]
MRDEHPIGCRRFCWSNPPTLIGGGCCSRSSAGPVGDRFSVLTPAAPKAQKPASAPSQPSDIRMTMDLQQRSRELCSGYSDNGRRTNSPSSTLKSAVGLTTTPAAVKRSFDVAFLVAPDTKNSRREPPVEDLSRKSAFTKVNGKESPEQSAYEGSLTSKHFQHQQQKAFQNYSLPPSNFILNSGREKLLSSYLGKPRSGYPYSGEKELLNIAATHPLLYPAEAYISAAYPYSNFMSAAAAPSPPAHQAPSLPRPSTSTTISHSPPASFLSVAVSPVSSLLPPSLAALSLPAQNVCAKCNLSFRMTSDLVYHMRSHHKHEAGDPLKRKREEKLKCPVCSESFRERHHLTRHMTAHQDKAGDRVDGGAELLLNAATPK